MSILSKDTPWWIAASYFTYIVLWEGFVLGGCAYVVFWMDNSGHWFWLAAAFSQASYRPSHWYSLWAGPPDDETGDSTE